MDESKKKMIQGYLEKAKSKLETTQILLNQKCFEDAVSRAYYAAFHAAQAVLFSEGIKARTHSGTVNQFGLLLVKTGKIDTKYGRFLSNLREDREVGDYEVFAPIDEQDAINAFRAVVRNFPQIKLAIVGQGDPKFTAHLKKLSTPIDIRKKVTYMGFISQNQKINLLKRAKIVLIPSVREGWNLVATEANATGAIPVAYDVPGLRDSIQNEKTGILTEKNPNELAKAAVQILKDDRKRQSLSKTGLKYAKNFSWDNTYEDIKNFIST